MEISDPRPLPGGPAVVRDPCGKSGNFRNFETRADSNRLFSRVLDTFINSNSAFYSDKPAELSKQTVLSRSYPFLRTFLEGSLGNFRNPHPGPTVGPPIQNIRFFRGFAMVFSVTRRSSRRREVALTRTGREESAKNGESSPRTH